MKLGFLPQSPVLVKQDAVFPGVPFEVSSTLSREETSQEQADHGKDKHDSPHQ